MWLRAHAIPWAMRRMRGGTAGDGRDPKHAGLMIIGGVAGIPTDRPADEAV